MMRWLHGDWPISPSRMIESIGMSLSSIFVKVLEHFDYLVERG